MKTLADAGWHYPFRACMDIKKGQQVTTPGYNFLATRINEWEMILGITSRDVPANTEIMPSEIFTEIGVDQQ